MGAWAELAEYVDVHLAPRGAEAAVDLEGLSEAERQRTALFKRAADAHRYAGGRAYLRRVLAAYLDCLPGDVPLRQADHLAKPYVAPSYGLDFSLARARSASISRRGPAAAAARTARRYRWRPRSPKARPTSWTVCPRWRGGAPF